ncbi:hypothetical protein JW992_03480 [candidate division KSB1 bacterium]|nr:hypothetical protein [candidate division KSB1 bacterium]
MGLRILSGVVAATVISLLSCSAPFVPQNYFPLQHNNRWVFSGPLKTLWVAEQEGETPLAHFRIASVDSLNNPSSWIHCRLTKDAVEWTAFEPFPGVLPNLAFDPPLLLSPFSNEIGEKKVVQGVEIRRDSLAVALRVRVIYTIDSIESVRVPAGDFPDCIKMRVSTLYLDAPEQPFLAGEVVWWLARNVGPVRYSTVSGEGELQAAEIGGKVWPQHSAL